MLTIHSSGVKILELCSNDYFTSELCTFYHYEWVSKYWAFFPTHNKLTHEFCKSPNWNPASTRNKLQQTSSFLAVH